MLVALAPLAGGAAWAHAQVGSVTVRGRVEDAESHAPIAGAELRIPKGPRAVSDAQGRFSFTVAQAGRFQLRVRAPHYQDLWWGPVDAMQPEQQIGSLRLWRVVADGQRSGDSAAVPTPPAAARHAGGDVQVVDPVRETADAAPRTLADILQGRAASIAVNRSSGDVGESTVLRFRGATSLNSSGAPIVTVDGFRISPAKALLQRTPQLLDPLNDLDPDDLEDIELLKGSATASRFGMDGAAGVIALQTRRAHAGQQRFEQTLRVDASTSEPAWSPRDNAGLCRAADTVASSPNPLCRLRPVGTLVRDNPLLRYGVLSSSAARRVTWSGRGGTNTFGFVLSSGFDDNAGTLPTSTFANGHARANLVWEPADAWRISVDGGASRSSTPTPLTFVRSARDGSPLTRDSTVIAPNGAQANRPDGWFGFGPWPSSIADLTQGAAATRTLLGADVTYAPNVHVRHRLRVGVAADAAHQNRSYDTQSAGTRVVQVLDSWRDDARRTFEYLGEFDWPRAPLRGWTGTLSVGAQYLHGTAGTVDRNVFVLPSGGSQETHVSAESKRGGLLAMLQLDYRDRVSLTLSERVDRFFDVASPESYPFAGIQFAYRPVDARWLRAHGVESFRLRSAWGEGARVPDLLADPITTPGFPLPPSPTLRPERGHELEGGADLVLASGRLALGVTWYEKEMRDLWQSRAAPNGVGGQITNVGSLRDAGLEATMDTRVRLGDRLTWNTHVVFATLTTRLTDATLISGPPGQSAVGLRNGSPIGVHEAQQIRSINPVTGVVTVDDSVSQVGKTLPGYEGGFQSSVTLGGWLTVHVSVDGRGDFTILNTTAVERELLLRNDLNRLVPGSLGATERLRRYGNPDTTQAAFVNTAGAQVAFTSPRVAYIMPGDFIRWRELGVTARLTDRMARLIGATNAQVTVAVTNVALWTRYDGPDPEVLTNLLNPYERTDAYATPHTRRYTVRVAVGF